KILIVHRQKEIVDLIKSVLSGCNPIVRHTESGLDGLLTSRIEHFDLIICGTDLPVVTGFELVRSIRTHSVNRNTSVVFIADELDPKTTNLVNAFVVAGMLATHDVDLKRASVVQENAQPAPDKEWDTLNGGFRLN